MARSPRVQTYRIANEVVRVGRGRVVALGLVGGAAAVAETVVLLLVARAALGLGKDDLDLPLVGTVGITTALWAGIGLLVAIVAARYVSARSLAATEAGLTLETRMRLVISYTRADFATQSSQDLGDFTAQMSNNTTQTVAVIVGVVSAVASGISIGVMVIAGCIVSPVLLSIVGVGSLLILALLSPLRRRARLAAAETVRVNRISALTALEVILNSVEIKTSGRGDAVIDHVTDVMESMREPSYRSALVRRLAPSVQLLTLLFLSVVGLLFLRSMGASDIDGVGTVVLIALRVLQLGIPLQAVVQTLDDAGPYVTELRDRLTAYERSFDQQSGFLTAPFEALEFRSVGFRYQGGERVALTNIDLELRRGESLAVVGPSGSGKTTLARLVLGLLDPTDGEIVLNGRYVSGLSTPAWHQTTGFVPQEAKLFTASLRDNIRLFDRTVDDARIERALEDAHLLALVAELDGGLDEMIGDRRVRNLSGGQRQRIALARALVTGPELLVLDEPTSALDPESEQVVSEALAALQGQLTLIVIAHRYSTIAGCDRIAVLDEGRLVDAGSLSDVRSRNLHVQSLVVTR